MRNRFMCKKGQTIQVSKMSRLSRFNLYLVFFISLLNFAVGGAQSLTPSPLSPLKPHATQESSSSLHSHIPHFTSSPLPEHILLSLKHFETLKKQANHHVEHAQWSNTKIQLDLAQIHTQKQVQVQITAQLTGSDQAWI